jgi:hypothetical protein
MQLPVRALILARISDADWITGDDGRRVLDTHGVDGQIADLLARAAALGWTVGPPGTHHIIENDTSAYKRVMCVMPYGRRERRPKRPRYWEALAMLNDSRADGLIAIDLDRAVRDPRDLEDLIDVCELRGVLAESVTGTLRLATTSDRAMARMLVAVANKSSADTARRVQDRKQKNTLAAKKVGGPRRFGWEPGNLELRSWHWPGFDVPPRQGEDGWESGEPVLGSEAAEVRAMADQVLHRVSLRQISMDLRNRGVPTTQGGQWDPTAVRLILLHPAIMGRLTYRPAHPAGVPRTNKARLYTEDQIKGPAPWPPIVSESEYWSIRSLLGDEKRRTSPGNTPRWLLSVLARCGACNGFATVTNDRHGIPVYRCRTCSAPPRRPVELADAYVTMVITKRLARADAADLVPRRVPSRDTRELERERGALKARKTSLARMHALGQIDDDDLAEGLAVIRERLTAIERQLDTGPRSPLESIAGQPGAEKIWAGMPLGLKREILRAAMSITFIPGPHAVTFDPASIAIEWKA